MSAASSPGARSATTPYTGTHGIPSSARRPSTRYSRAASGSGSSLITHSRPAPSTKRTTWRCSPSSREGARGGGRSSAPAAPPTGRPRTPSASRPRARAHPHGPAAAPRSLPDRGPVSRSKKSSRSRRPRSDPLAGLGGHVRTDASDARPALVQLLSSGARSAADFLGHDAVRVDREAHLQLGAERLDEAHVGLQRAAPASPLAAGRLRPDPGDHRLAGMGASRGSTGAPRRSTRSSGSRASAWRRPRRASPRTGSSRRADERRHEQFSGWS